MNRKLVLMLTLTLLMSMLNVAFNVQRAKASGTIYIRADGSIDPLDAPISTFDNVTYTLVGNITSTDHGMVVERDDIVVDGAGYTVTGSGIGHGITLSHRTNVTVRNMTIENFVFGIYLYSSSVSVLSGNNVTANNGTGIGLDSSSNNTLFGNNLANNRYGVNLYLSYDNMFYHNNFIDSTQHDYVETAGYANVWDDGYPSDRSIDLAATTGVATMEQMQTMMALATLHTSLMHIIQTNTHLWFHM